MFIKFHTKNGSNWYNINRVIVFRLLTIPQFSNSAGSQDRLRRTGRQARLRRAGCQDRLRRSRRQTRLRSRSCRLLARTLPPLTSDLVIINETSSSTKTTPVTSVYIISVNCFFTTNTKFRTNIRPFHLILLPGFLYLFYWSHSLFSTRLKIHHSCEVLKFKKSFTHRN